MRSSTQTPSRAARLFMAGVLFTIAGSCAAPERHQPPRIGEAARPYAAATLEGDTVSLESLKGDVVLLNLWATWCTPCREETPYLQEIFEEHRDRGFHIVGASMDNR